MEIEIRLTRTGEHRTACDTMCRALLTSPPDDDRWAKSRTAWESSISYSAWDGDDCVGHAANLHVETTVPGGAALATGAVTWVGVLTTHARRGVGTGLMRALIDDATERQWPLMSLRASEATIYRRYGFGVAGDFAAVEIESRRARPVRGAAAGAMRLLSVDEVPAVVDEVYRRCLGRRPGLITRPDPWVERHFRAVGESKDNALVAVHLDGGGEPDGYVYYTTSWSETLEQGGKGVIHDVFAVSDEVELALWRYLLTIDLVETWKSLGRPIDDLVIEAVADRRAYRITSVMDEQWLRLLDVGVSLRARTYSSGGDGMVVAVTDPLIDRNNGRWHIDGSGARRTDEPAHLVADIDALSALYLGGMSWRTEAAVGRVRPGPAVDNDRYRMALAAADRLFAVKPLPFCGTFF
ncbi:MAG: GNAT family N-acetyltransferase [Acidimicrobiia bacterium]|nr:GNAT family N-acetyltransferase [Acidimicrobiia bacterium]